ncbi:MAG: small subunit ribosomal protein S4 [Candidatus Paceibacteria bacterium]|jgi:small subunit ribosomal protein S4
MITGPKYKIARRLGHTVFEKTQDPKFVLREQSRRVKRTRRPRSNYGIQLIDKQKVRFTYGLTEKQFSNYVKAVIEKKLSNPSEKLSALLEKRLDNVVFRSNFVKTRQASRQAVSHGHITVNGKKMNIPSYQVKDGDVVAIKEASIGKGLWVDLTDKDTNLRPVPKWVLVNAAKKEINIKGEPEYSSSESDFDLPSVLQYYKR